MGLTPTFHPRLSEIETFRHTQYLHCYFKFCLALRTTRCWFVLYSLFPGYHWQAVPLEKPVWLRVPTGVGTGRFTTHRNWAGLTFFPPTRDSCVGRSMYTAHTAYDWTHLFLWFLHYWFEPRLVSSVSRRSRRHIRRIPCRLTGPLTRFCFCTQSSRHCRNDNVHCSGCRLYCQYRNYKKSSARWGSGR